MIESSMEGLILKLSHSRLLELEELLGVVITDVLNHLIDAFHFGNGNFIQTLRNTFVGTF